MNPEALDALLSAEHWIKPAQADEPEPNELIWYGDFGHQTIASILWHRVRINDERIRTYGQLAQVTEQQLLDAGVLQDELSVVKNALVKKKFTPTKTEAAS